MVVKHTFQRTFYFNFRKITVGIKLILVARAIKPIWRVGIKVYVLLGWGGLIEERGKNKRLALVNWVKTVEALP